MSTGSEKNVGAGAEAKAVVTVVGVAPALRHELQHLQANWCWFMLLGVLLVICGTVALVFPVITSFAATVVLGAVLLVAGVATIITAFWSGKWSGLLVQLLVGILYVVAGLAVSEHPVITTVALTVLIAVSFLVMGAFRAMAALLVRFPQWGWALLNGVITFLCGAVIFRSLRRVPEETLWVIGLIVGLEMLFSGWTWIMLSLEIRKLPKEARP
jgi:uncharacterized membrane protein HdeD (DUF308 family)